MEQLSQRHTHIKFGGGPLKDLSPTIVDLVDQRITELTLPGTIPFITVSALGGVTNELEKVYETAQDGGFEDAIAALNTILGSHRRIVDEHVKRQNYLFTTSFKELCGQARAALRRVLSIRKEGVPIDPDQSVRAELVATGELLSGLVLKTLLDTRGYSTFLLHGNGFMLGAVTNEKPLYTNAVFLREQSRSNLLTILEEDQIVITQAAVGSINMGKRLIMTPGFVGSDINDRTKTVNFGRESSDLTALEAAIATCPYGEQPLVHFVKDIDPSRPIKAVDWGDLLTMERETGTHLISESALQAATAVETYVRGIIVDITTGARYEINP